MNDDSNITTTFFLYRHGETAWNAEGRYQGHADVPLNENGRAQARALTPILRELDPQLLAASDLSRARETAELANVGWGLALVIDPRLREIDVGELSGRTRDEMASVLGVEGWRRWTSVAPDDLEVAMPGGETKGAQLARCQASLRAIAAAHRETRRVAVCTHGGAIRRLVHAARGAESLAPIALPNGCIYSLRLEGDAFVYGGRIDAGTLHLHARNAAVFE